MDQSRLATERHASVLLITALQYRHRVVHDSGYSARTTINGSFIGRNAGTGFDFLNVNARLSRVFPIRERLQIEGIAEAFNLLNHLKGVSLNGTFGTGAYPTNPLPTFKQITAVADSRTLQMALRLRF